MSEQNGRMHNQVAELLSAYMDGEVTGEERALVEAHLATCAACARDLGTLRQTVSLLRQLPQVAAPRPFTLREADVRPLRPAGLAWWRLPWARSLVAATAMLLCVVVVAGVWLLGRPGRLGTPAAPAPVAMQAPMATEAPAEERAAEKAAQAEKEVEVTLQVEAPAAAVEAPAATGEAAAELGMLEAAPAEPATPELSMAQEIPVTATPAQAETLSDAGAAPAPTVAARAAAATPMPAATPAPPAEAMKVVSPTLLLQVEELQLEIKPGVIRARGRLPLPEGRKLSVELWREGQLVEWAIPESQQAVVGANGQFLVELQARPDVQDFDLFAAGTATYELRLRPVDPPEPVEARIPFDSYGPPPASPTNAP